MRRTKIEKKSRLGAVRGVCVLHLSVSSTEQSTQE
eukprot:COSAG02_NODE_64534_length_260_cov_0.645963_1_plen_34_part_10